MADEKSTPAVDRGVKTTAGNGTPAAAPTPPVVTASLGAGGGASPEIPASPQLDALCQRAVRGAVEDVQRLAKWSALVEQEAQLLRRRLRKQHHDFTTLIEIVGQTSAR